jgi:protein-disulfide isomerase
MVAAAATLAVAAAPAPKTPARQPAPARGRWPAAPGDMNLGAPNAPVHVVEYLSLTCPHCAHFNAEVFPAFKAKYVDNRPRLLHGPRTADPARPGGRRRVPDGPLR